MKYILQILLFTGIFLCVGAVKAQAPNGINYQAVIRNNTGTLMANTPTAIRVSIRQSTATGTIVYSERQNVTTDQFGLVNFVIGSGTLLSGNFTNIPWGNGPFFLDLGVAFSGLPAPITYMPYGTQQMMSVPYALYAKSSGNLVNQWSYGAGVPASNLGLVGDYYLDTATGNVYSKTNATTWVLISNIMGPQGPQGIPGQAGVGNFTHFIGEQFGGGIIFYLWKDALNVEHGLIVDKTNLSTNQVWSNLWNTVIGISVQSTWDGLTNSSNIVNQLGHTNSAASLCLNSINSNQSDWYLPSIDELSLLWQNRFLVNKTLSTINGATLISPSILWSSTESYLATNAYSFSFEDGIASGGLAKSAQYYVRAIRSF